MNKKILVLGGGVAGSSMAYYLSEKGYDVTVIERNSAGRRPGADLHLQRPSLRVRAAHLVLAGRQGGSGQRHDRQADQRRAVPHRSAAVHVRRGRPAQVPLSGALPGHRRRCRSATRSTARSRQNRDEQLKLIDSQLPELGQCKFGDYFTAAIGATLYQKFMANYTWKMWNIPGDELETSMVWADRFHHAYTKQGREGVARARRLRPAEVRGPHARQGHPVPGLSETRVERRLGRDGRAVDRHPRSHRRDRGRAQAAVRPARERRQTLFRRLPHGVLLDRHRRAVGREHAALHRPDDDSAADSRTRATRFPKAPSRCTTRPASSRRA